MILFSAGEVLVIPLAVVSIAAGGYQLVATADAWTIDASGNATQTTLTPAQWSQATLTTQQLSNDPSALSSALDSANQDAGSLGSNFLVPQVDASGNMTTSIAEPPVSSTVLANGDTQYTFQDGTTLTVEGSSTDNGNISMDAFDRVWSIPITGGGTATLDVNSGNGSFEFTAKDGNGNVLNNLSLDNSTSTSNGVTTTTQDVYAAIGGEQSAQSTETLTYNAAGTLTEQQINGEGSSTTMVYDPLTGALLDETIINADGSQSQLWTNSDGSQTMESWNAHNQETSLEQINVNGSSTTTSYDPSTGTVTAEAIVNANGSQTDYTFGSDGSETVLTYNAAGTLTEQQNYADGASTSIVYSPSTGALLDETIINADGSQSQLWTNSDGSQTMESWNAHNQETSLEQINVNGSSTTTSYDPSTGTVTAEAIVNANGSQTDYTFGSDGSETVLTYNAAGTLTEQQNYADGKRLCSTSIIYSPSTGALLDETIINADGSQSQLWTNSDGSQTMESWNAHNQETSLEQINVNGSSTTTSYDPSTGAVTAEAIVNAKGSQTDYTFGSDGSETVLTYNAAGTLTEQQNYADGASTSIIYSPSTGALLDETIINADGSQSQLWTNSDGSQTMESWNAHNQETSLEQINLDGSWSETSYDPSTGAVTGDRIVNADGSWSDLVTNSDGSQTSQTYSAAGTLTGQDQYNVDGSQTQESFYAGQGQKLRCGSNNVQTVLRVVGDVLRSQPWPSAQ